MLVLFIIAVVFFGCLGWVRWLSDFIAPRSSSTAVVGCVYGSACPLCGGVRKCPDPNGTMLRNDAFTAMANDLHNGLNNL